MKLPQPAQLVTGVVFGLIGTLVVTNVTAQPASQLRRQDNVRLRDLAIAESSQVAQLQTRLGETEARVVALTEGESQSAQSALNSRVQQLGDQAGVTEMAGQGLKVTLSDAPSLDPVVSSPSNVPPEAFIIHEEDIQAVVNALWRGGAKGISIMGLRIIESSAVKCVGNVLLLQGQVFSPPYEIYAIGDPSFLEQSLNTDPGVARIKESVERYRIGLAVQRQPLIELPAYVGPLVQRFAKPLQ
ncbi:MAG: DUF881 domain-containing protein [Actinobacteria bacterium]|nr:DUF881 domain-containing protein [Actinomycetota bacterium]